jgi:hypothetical protein
MPEWRKFEFKREKFIELMLYFSKRGLDEKLVIGSTKLNKLLFFSDFRAYAELGEPITGAKYQKLEWGPAPRALLPVRDELVEHEDVRFQERSPDDWGDVLEPLREPDLSLFSQDELRIASEVFEEMRQFNAAAISDYSHLKSAGWLVVDYKDDIPYESAFTLTDPAPPEAIQLGRELAAQYGW